MTKRKEAREALAEVKALEREYHKNQHGPSGDRLRAVAQDYMWLFVEAFEEAEAAVVDELRIAKGNEREFTLQARGHRAELLRQHEEIEALEQSLHAMKAEQDGREDT